MLLHIDCMFLSFNTTGEATNPNKKIQKTKFTIQREFNNLNYAKNIFFSSFI